MGGFRVFSLIKILITITVLVPFVTVACSETSTPSSSSTSFSYLVHVLAKNTGEDIAGAEVTIEVTGQAPLNGVTDSTGIARIFVSPDHSGKPGLLIIEAQGYDRHWQNIDLYEDRLPSIIQLDPIEPGSTYTPTAPPTSTPTSPPSTDTATPTAIPPTATATSALPPPTNTSTTTPRPPTNTFTPIPAPTKTTMPPTEPTATTKPTTPISGKLAVPLVLGTTPKIFIANTGGALLGHLDMARQPDYTRDGSRLVVNGDGGELDKLRVTGPTGGDPSGEIGDPGLSGHSHPAWSPDGTHIVYDDGTIDPVGWHIFTCDCGPREGEGERLEAAGGPILDPHPLYPLWTSQDRFVFRGCDTWATGIKCGIWVTESNYGTPEQFTENPNHIPTDVDGDIVVYSSQEAGDWNIYRLNLATGKTRQLTFDPAADGLATISPDGQMVAFLSNRGGGLAVWIIGISRGAPQKLFDIPTEWGVLRGDGWTEEKLSWGQ